MLFSQVCGKQVMDFELERDQVNPIVITTDWEFDKDFITLLQESIEVHGGRNLIVDADNLNEVCRDVQNGRLKVAALIDRASDTSPAFIPLQTALSNKNVPIFDPIDQIDWVSDKATLHLEFLTAGIRTPYTIILPPYEEKNTPALHVDDLAHLGRSFVIKPANTTGGGVGVVNEAESLQEVLHARKEFQSDKYLLQEQIIPIEKDGYRFWFRSFYVGGHVFTTWWDDRTHHYSTIEPHVCERYGLKAIPGLMQKIASVSKLTFFSSEIACSNEEKWVIVDYVNEACDMRLQSKYKDGVPDELVNRIAQKLIETVFEQIHCGNV